MMKNKLLVIDDEEDIREMIYDYFTVRGFQVRTVDDGDQGLKATVDFQPDVILLDIKMKRIDGSQIIHKLKVERPECKVFVISAYQDDRSQKLVKEQGADEFFEKPIPVKELERVVREAMGERND